MSLLGLNDIVRCESDDPITLSALNSPVGPNAVNYTWTRDSNNDGVPDEVVLTGANASELTISPPDSGRYFVTIEDTSGGLTDDDILVTWITDPVNLPAGAITVEVIDDFINGDLDSYNIQINVVGNGDYQYSINGGDFQDDPVFLDVPAGENFVVINEKNGCGQTPPISVFVLGYPRFFTPNGDGENETWNLRGVQNNPGALGFAYKRLHL